MIRRTRAVGVKGAGPNFMLRTYQAAKTLCALSDWRVSNLSLQKLLYLSHMVMLGEKGAPLIDTHFEAWDFGPVEPNIYHRAKAYGSGPVADVFPVRQFSTDSNEFSAIKTIYDQVGKASPGRLVALTHLKDGAWDQYYRPNVRGIIIPDEAIKNEYRGLVRKQQERRSQSAPICA